MRDYDISYFHASCTSIGNSPSDGKGFYSGPQEKFASVVFERAFKDFGLPAASRTDNGVSFASAKPA